MDRIFPDFGPLAQTLFRHSQETHFFLDHVGGNNFIVLDETNTDYTSGSPSDRPDIVLPEAGGKPAPGADYDVIVTRGLFNRNELVAFIERHSYYSFCPGISIFTELRLFDNAGLGEHYKITLVEVFDV